jgi:hypothetical protein
MNTAVVLVGLAVLVALQTAIHIRIAGMPTRTAARLRSDAKAQARASADVEANALQTAIAKRVGVLVGELAHFHEYASEDYQARVAAAAQRARVAEVRNTDASKVVTGLRGHADDAAKLVQALRDHGEEATKLVSDLRRTLAEVAEMVQGPPPLEDPPAPSASEPAEEPEGSERTTTRTGDPSDGSSAAAAPDWEEETRVIDGAHKSPHGADAAPRHAMPPPPRRPAPTRGGAVAVPGLSSAPAAKSGGEG